MTSKIETVKVAGSKDESLLYHKYMKYCLYGNKNNEKRILGIQKRENV